MTDADIRRLARQIDGHMNDRSSGIDLPWESLIKIVRAAIAAEQDRCCGIVFGMAGSDNVAQRTVDEIRWKG